MIVIPKFSFSHKFCFNGGNPFLLCVKASIFIIKFFSFLNGGFHSFTSFSSTNLFVLHFDYVFFNNKSFTSQGRRNNGTVKGYFLIQREVCLLTETLLMQIAVLAKVGI